MFMWGLVPKFFSVVGRCYHFLPNYSSLLPEKGLCCELHMMGQEQLAEVLSFKDITDYPKDVTACE